MSNLEKKDFESSTKRLNFIETLNEVSSTVVAQWIKDALVGEGGGIFEVAWGHEEAVPSILRYYDFSTEVGIKRKFKRAVGYLFRQAEWANDSPYYLADILSLVGYLKVRGVFNELLQLAFSGELKTNTLNGSDEDLHLHALGAIVAIGYKPGIMTLLKQDILDKKYFSFCYQGLWERNSDNAIKYLPIIVGYCHDDPKESDLPFLLDTFFRSVNNLEYIANKFIPMALESLPEPIDLKIFYESLKEVQYYIELDGFQYRIQYKSEENCSNYYSQDKLTQVFITFYHEEEKSSGGLGAVLFKLNELVSIWKT